MYLNLTIVTILLISCSSNDKVELLVQDSVSDISDEFQSIYLVSLNTQCVGCKQNLREKISTDKKTHYLLFTYNQRDNRIYFSQSGSNNFTIFSPNDFPEISELLNDQVILYHRDKQKLDFIPRQKFYNQKLVNSSQVHLLTDSGSMVIDSVRFEKKAYKIEQVKRHKGFFYILGVFGDGAGQTKALFKYKPGLLELVTDLRAIGEGREYPLGINDFILEDDIVYLFSTMEIIMLDLSTGRLIKKLPIELPSKHFVDSKSFDIQQIGDLFLIPVQFGYAYNYDPEIFKATAARYLVIDKDGKQIDQFGNYPASFGLNSLLLSNSSLATYKDGVVQYTFPGVGVWHNYTIGSKKIDQATEHPVLPITASDLNYCDSASYWHNELEVMTLREKLRVCENDYYRNYSYGPNSELLDGYVKNQGSLQYYMFYKKAGNDSPILKYIPENQIWIENPENSLLFFGFDKKDNTLRIFKINDHADLNSK